MTHTDIRYLEAKRTVDDRGLSRRVRDRLLAELPPEPAILDAGCGTGAMLARLHEWGVTAGSYRGVDRDGGVISFARQERPRELRRRGAAVVEAGDARLVDDLSVTFESGDALASLGGDTDTESGADLLVAAAFADLVPLEALLAMAASALRPGGLAYLPITFDGGTIFQPDHPADDAIERAYHDALERRPGRDPRAGRHLADLLGRRDGDLLAVAASDWVVRPRNGAYPGDEAYFIACILEFIAEALGGDARDGGVDRLGDWLATRRRQLDAGELLYVAHQYDLLYRTPTAAP